MRYRELLSWASAGGEKRAFFPLLGIGTKKQIFLENLKSASWFRLIGLILAITVYLPVVWYPLYTRVSFTILVWCSDELAGHSWLGLPDAFYKNTSQFDMSTVPDLSCVVFRKWHRENRKTINIVSLSHN